LLVQLQRTTQEFVRKVEQKWGVAFPEGRNPDISFMAHVWEDLRVLPKPLAMHVASEAITALSHCALRLMGFQKQSCQVGCMDTVLDRLMSHGICSHPSTGALRCHGFCHWIRPSAEATAKLHFVGALAHHGFLAGLGRALILACKHVICLSAAGLLLLDQASRSSAAAAAGRRIVATTDADTVARRDAERLSRGNPHRFPQQQPPQQPGRAARGHDTQQASPSVCL
jgi:hypothetical protein